MYKAKVTFFEELEDKTKTHRLFVSGENYQDALEQITNYYSEDTIESFSLAPFSPDNFIIFEQEQKELFKQVAKTLSDKIIW